MGTYLMMLYVTLDQEEALKKFFLKNQWSFCKPDLSALTENVGPPCIPELIHPTEKLANKPSKKSTTKKQSMVSKDLVCKDDNHDQFVYDGLDTDQDELNVCWNKNDDTKLKRVDELKNNSNNDQVSADTIPTELLTPRKSSRLSQKRKHSWSVLATKRKKSGNKDKDACKEVKKESDALVSQLCGQEFPSINDCKEHERHVHDSVSVKEEVNIEGNHVFRGIGNEVTEAIVDQGLMAEHEKRTDTNNSVKTQLYSKTKLRTGDLDAGSLCNNQAKDKSVPERHYQQEHNMALPQKKGPRYSCSVCNKVFISLKCFKTHIEGHEVDVDGQKADRSYPCNFCTVTFDKPQGYKNHLNESHKESLIKDQVHICEYCGKIFRRSDYLKEHRNVVHLGVKKKLKDICNDTDNICEICGAKFKRKCHLEEHISLKHNNTPVTVHPCTHCSQIFHRPSKLEYHVNKEHLHSKPYSCEKCEGKFYSHVALKYHIRACVMSEDSMVTCEHCGKKFKSNHNYKLHIQAVHSDPALICACGTVVRWQSSVTKHKRRCPLNTANLGEKVRRKTVKNMDKHVILIQNNDTVQYETKELAQYTQYVEMDCAKQARTSLVKDIHEVVAEVDSATGMLTYTTDEAQVNEIDTEAVQKGLSEAAIDDDIMNDLINGVEEQVVEISSTPQLTVHQEESADAQHVYYVILKK